MQRKGYIAQKGEGWDKTIPITSNRLKVRKDKEWIYKRGEIHHSAKKGKIK